MRARHRKMEQKRQQDARKLSDLQHSITRRNLDFGNVAQPPSFPESEIEGIFDIHTTADWRDLFGTLYDAIAKQGGHPEFAAEKATVKKNNNKCLRVCVCHVCNAW